MRCVGRWVVVVGLCACGDSTATPSETVGADGGSTGGPSPASTGSDTTAGVTTSIDEGTTAAATDAFESTSTGIVVGTTEDTTTGSTGPALDTDSTGPSVEPETEGSSSTGWQGCDGADGTGGPMCLGDDCFSDDDCCDCLVCALADEDDKSYTCVPAVQDCGTVVAPCEGDGDCCSGLTCSAGMCGEWGSCVAPMGGCFPGDCCPGLTCDFGTSSCLPLDVAECTDDVGSMSTGVTGVGTCEDGVQAAGEFCYRSELIDINITPTDIALADFDGDSNLDIAVVGGQVVTWGCRERLTILLGDGTGGFTASTQPLPAWMDHVVADDVTGDGTPDLVTGGYNRTVVWEGVGDGTFTAGDLMHGALLGAADMNDDGSLDMIVAVGSNSIRLLLNDGLGSFTHDDAESAGPGQWRVVAAADFDYDDHADVFSGSGSLLGGDGAGALTYVDDYEVGQMLGASLEDAIVVDFDGGGEPALVTVGTGGILNILPTVDPTGPGDLVEHDLPGQSLAVAAGQLDGNGLVDLAVTQRLSAEVLIYSGSSIDDLSQAASFEVGTGGFDARPTDVEIGDIDGDGHLDIVTAQYNEGSITVLIAEP